MATTAPNALSSTIWRSSCATIFRVSRTVKLVAVVLLLAIMPLRGLAAVTVGFCAMGHHEAPAQSHGQHGGHHHEAPAEPQGKADCSICVEHCSSASFAVPAPADVLLARDGARRIALDEAFAAGFVPDHLDPPPLAL